MKDFFSFLKTKTFFKHFGLALVSVCLILYILFKLLGSYTNHGEMVEVPDFKGQPIGALNNFIEGKEVRYEIIDSIYSPKEKPGTVLKQDPLPKVMVKHNRTIYLYVTSQLPPMMKMPRLVGSSLRIALALIQSYELKVAGKPKMVPGDKGAVVKQFVDGKEQTIKIRNDSTIWPEYMVKKGSLVTLWVGEGESTDRTDVPDLTGMSFKDAVQTLNNKGLAEGLVDIPSGMTRETAGLKVYKQEPAAGEDVTIRVGGVIDIYLSK